MPEFSFQFSQQHIFRPLDMHSPNKEHLDPQKEQNEGALARCYQQKAFNVCFSSQQGVSLINKKTPSLAAQRLCFLSQELSYQIFYVLELPG